MSRPPCPFDLLPVELFASILSELDIVSLISASAVSSTFRSVVSSSLLNPWRQPIRRALLSSGPYDPAFSTLGARLIVPRRNWIEILSLAKVDWLLFEAVLPNLREAEWEEAFKRRWLPSMRKWRKDGKWKQAFMKTLMRIWHRLGTSCTADESWCKYVVLNRNGSANNLEAYARTYSPLAVFDELKLQSNLMHLETQTRLLVQFLDIRVIVLGVLHHSNSLFVNSNARQLLHPPGVQSWVDEDESSSEAAVAPFVVPGMSPRALSSTLIPQPPPNAPPAPHSPSLPNPYTALLTSTANPLTRTRSNEAAVRGRPFLRTRSRDSDAPPTAPPGIFRRLTISFGDRMLSTIGGEGGPSVPLAAELAAVQTIAESSQAGLHQPIAESSQAGPSRVNGVNGHSNLTTAISAPLETLAPQASRRSAPSVSPSSRTRPLGELPFAPIRYPTPILAHRNYPNYTAGGADNRWHAKGSLIELDEGGKLWAGPMMILAQLVNQDDTPSGYELDIAGEGRFASFTIQDLFAVAPWMEERVTKTIEGMGLGNP